MRRHVDISRFLVNGLLAVGCGALAWRMLARGEAIGWLFATLALACAIALMRRWGAIVPCTTIGIVLGIVLDVGPRTGPVELQMRETAESWIGGALAGLLVGVAMDWHVRAAIDHADKPTTEPSGHGHE